MDAISGIGGLSAALPGAVAAPRVAPTATPGGADFGRMLGDAVKELSAEMKIADTLAASFATGDNVDLHTVMLQTNRATLMLSAGVAVRDRLLDAYHEIMRMQL